MTRPGARRLGAALGVVLALGGCQDEPEPGTEPEAAPVDSALVALLADVGLAEARADLAPPDRRAALTDSLRAVALAAHGASASALEAQQRRLARDPVMARATYDAVDRALTDERYGTGGASGQ